jgi:hypothetical protein
MTWLGMRNKMDDILELINNRLSELYVLENSENGLHFKNNKSVVFSVHKMGEKDPWNFFVIGYEDTGEDGDAFYPEDYNDFEEMFHKMLEEIES